MRRFTLKARILLSLGFILLLAACQIGPKTTNLKGTSWDLLEIEGQPILAGTHATLEFNEKTVSGGNAGCNRWGAQTTEIEGKSITFEEIIMTEMACLDDAGNVYTGLMDQERRYLDTLSRVREYKMEGKSLALLGEDGATLLLFQPASP